MKLKPLRQEDQSLTSGKALLGASVSPSVKGAVTAEAVSQGCWHRSPSVNGCFDVHGGGAA